MIGISRFKLAFFDQQRVVGAADKVTRRVLSRFGAFVRRSAKSSIRRRKRSSLPGEPPSSHEGSLRRLILFGYDRQRKSVVIGPAAFREAEAPSLLEFGGSVVRRDRRGRSRRQRYRPRPFMGPAFEKERPKLPSMWRDSITPRK